MKTLKYLSDKNIGIICLLIFIIHFTPGVLSSNEIRIDFFNQFVFNNELIFILAYYIVTSFCYGYLSYLIAAKCFNLRLSFAQQLGRFRMWLPRALIFILIFWLGIVLLIAVSHLVFGSLGARDFAPLAVIIWSLTTYTLHPTFIVLKYSVKNSLLKSLAINYQSLLKWLPWYLFLAFIAGTYTFIWLPLDWSKSLMDLEVPYFSWQLHGQWLGGYYFIPFWYSDLINWLKIKPTIFFDALVILMSVIISTLVKIKITRILIDNNYLVKSETVFDE